jgi:anti-sigma factor RsiW
MSINRSNYEEFFLLYLDAELTPQQRLAVEKFVQLNPDVAEELEMLKQTKLLPETHFRFGNKDTLLRSGEADINYSNYEEYFLLYIDNELTDTEKVGVEKFISQHPKLRDEFTLLKNSVLEPPIIAFKNKEELYRTEQKHRRITPIKWVIGIAAAAAVTGIVATILWLTPATNVDDVAVSNVPVENESAQVDELNKSVDKIKIEEQPYTQTKKDVATITSSENKNKGKKSSDITSLEKQATVKPVIAVVNKTAQEDKALVLTETRIDIKPEPSIAKLEAPARKIDTKALKPLEETSVESTKIEEAAYVTKTRNALTQAAVYKELDTDEDDSRTLYVGSMQINKDKVKGVFKKATRLFGGKAKDLTDDEDGKLQVANFEIDTRKLK